MLTHQPTIINSFARSLDESIARAISFLIGSKNSEGLWLDFRLADGSDEYVTAYVGTILSETGDEAAVQAAWQAWDRFGSRNFFSGLGGWAYKGNTPEDADSTAWGIKFALNLGLRDKTRTVMAERFLRKHIRDDGGVACYNTETAFCKLIRKSPDIDMTGWHASHPCITAAAAVLPMFNKELVPYLLSHQLPEGCWGAYWFSDIVYTTAFAVEALMLNDGIKYRPPIERALSWVIARFDGKSFISNDLFPLGSPFATALALRTLAVAGDLPVFRKKIEDVSAWLLDQQKEDGSWEPSTTMLLPKPSVKISYNYGEITEEETKREIVMWIDHLSVFTTATVLDCLVRSAKRITSL